MSRVEVMKAARVTPSVKFMEFTRIYSSKGKEHCVSFFEGEDAKYYTVRINNILNTQQITSVNCGGKKNVIGVRKLIRDHRDYSDAFCMFFVDRDFDDNSELSNWQDTYVTPCYSVENFYLNIESLCCFMMAEMNISPYGEEKDCYNRVLDIYRSFISDVEQRLLDFNLWIYIYKVNESRGRYVELNLNNIDLDKLVEFDGFALRRIYGTCLELFPNAYEVDDEMLLSARNYFEDVKVPLLDKLRGKQLLECLRIFLEALKRDRTQKKDRIVFENRGNVKIMLTKNNMLSEYSQYAHTPICLKQFLAQQPIHYSRAS
ncbi:DUF4435 domain-containing protein [Klebsiella pneumoniae]|nr:DUF4435 domain-containing protein [Klebsiella pneumoniae]EIY6169560.1 DUF4435 domain-containing protein [Escherichia coli]MDX7913431.1 DUF4435 domain-containing protein [Klebsiella pneumoniae]SXG24029.1 Uncharacterised protein [Klebsiella pneumoniae]HAW8035165.1 DUF4435 domain-containing protein [Escherichia coli]